MNTTERFIGINLFILVLYTFLIHAFVGKGDAMAAAMFSFGHAGILIVLAIVTALRNKPTGVSNASSLVFTALVIAIIGFSVCLGTFSLH